MPAVSAFLDANFILYLHDRKAPAKAAAIESWLGHLASRDAARTNLQVLNEVTSVLLRRKWFSSPSDVFRIIDEVGTFGAAPIGWSEVSDARRLHERYRYSWWDSLLLASALRLGCTHFLSEDLQDGQAVDGLTIVDPFAHSPRDVLPA